MWKKMRSTVMFGIACITSPCCTPLIVPLIAALLVGTPAAAWMQQYIGWVYAGLTVISLSSLLLGLWWLRRSSPRRTRQVSAIRSHESNL